MKHTLWPLAFSLLTAPITASMAQEPSLICFGNEPSWRLDLTEPGTARFSTPDSAGVDYVGAATAPSPRKESVWRGQAAADGGELVALLREGARAATRCPISCIPFRSTSRCPMVVTCPVAAG